MSLPQSDSVWLNQEEVLALHERSIERFGGSAGIRDRGLLQSALDRPQNRFAYGGVSSLSELAAAYGFGIAKNHPFVDGNKRTAFAALDAFLFLNGVLFLPPPDEAAPTIEQMAAGALTEDDLAAWIAEHSRPLP